MEELIGILSGESELHGTLSEAQSLTGELSIPDRIGTSYSGPYEVVPEAGFQLLPTEERYLEEDIIVHPIPYSEVSNEHGGWTVTIGG